MKKAEDLGLEVVEVGRCPVYYLDNAPTLCKMHQGMVKLSGTAARPAQSSFKRGLRIMWLCG